MDDEDEAPAAWVSILKIIIAMAVLVGAVWFALWYAGRTPRDSPAMEQAIEYVRQETAKTPSKGDSGGWGIFHDSPLRRK